MLRKFASLKHGKTHAYAFDSDAYDYKAPLYDHFRMYETYGDGLTQHSGDWSVTLEYLTDYLFSLATAMQTDAELVDRLKYAICDRPSKQAIEFAASIVFKEGKTRYFDLRERKISSSDSKRYDKRYTEITDVYDGSAKSIFRILSDDCTRGIAKFAYAHAIREWALDTDCMDSKDRPYMQLEAVFLNWVSDNDSARQMRDAFHACLKLIEASFAVHSAKIDLENYGRSIAFLPVETTASE